VIVLQHVSKTYRTTEGKVRALDDVSLDVETGRFLAIRGPSGSGKSTLLGLVGGLDLASDGTVRVAGHDLAQMSASQRARFRAETLGFVFQMFHLLPYLSVLDNVVVAALPGSASRVVRRAKELLAEFDLSDRMRHHPSQLSAGERQRVAMARALINEPKLLLADEPTGNLDAESAARVLGLLSTFHQNGGTVLMVTHEEVAAGYAEQAIVLKKGRLLAAPVESETV